MAYVVPALICLIYLKGYYDMFAGKGTGVLLGWMAFAVLLLAVIFWVCFSTGQKNRFAAGEFRKRNGFCFGVVIACKGDTA